MINSVGREIPDAIEGYKKVAPFKGALKHIERSGCKTHPSYRAKLGREKVLSSIKEAILKVELKDGMTISFHHHLRNGDYVTNMVVDEISKLGIKELKLMHSALFDIHELLLQHIKNGVITSIEADYISSGLGKRLCQGLKEGTIRLNEPIKLLTHGGRARRIESGDTHIDVAFIASPTADIYGNINGVDGRSACGSLGYSFPDAEYADYVVAITDNLVSYPLSYISIDQTHVDYVVEVDKIGDATGIVSGTTKSVPGLVGTEIAYRAAKVIEASGLLQTGFSFQTGAGGISLATAQYLGEIMVCKKLTGSFGLGGITSYFIDLLDKGLLKVLLDVQDFDLKSVESLKNNPNHVEIGASMYANPHTKGCATDMLTVSVLGATEIDVNFNVNVTTASDGTIMGGSGGHSDSAAGSKLSIVVAPIMRDRIPIVVDEVLTVTTPGETVDVLVTERGIAVNPRREDLLENLKGAKLQILGIEELKNMAYKYCGVPRRPEFKDKIIAVQEYRDGTIIDVIRGLV